MSLAPQQNQHTEDVGLTPLNGQALESTSQLAPQKNQHTEDVSLTPLNGQALESASQLLNVPELLAAVLEHMHPDASLVPAACVSKTWGELATAANWQRCWIDVRKLMMVLHTCSYYMTVRIVHGEIEAGTLVGYKESLIHALDEAKERFLRYCAKTVNLYLSMGVDENAILQLRGTFPENIPLLPRLRRVKADSQGEWTKAAPVFLGPTINFLKMALHYPSDRVLAGFVEFKGIKHLHLTYRARDRKIDFASLEMLQTVVAEHVERASSFWENLSESRSLREIEIRSTDGSVPASCLQFPALQLLSLPAKDFILWTSNATAIPTPEPSTAVDNLAVSRILPSRSRGAVDQPTFPSLRSLCLLQEARPLGIHLVNLLQGLRHHAPRLRKLDCGHGKSQSLPEVISKSEFYSHFKSETTRGEPLNVELERREQLADDDFARVASWLGEIKELRLRSSTRAEALTPDVLVTLARHATSLNVLKLRLNVKEELEASSFPAESFANLEDVDVYFDGGGSSVIPYASMLAHMCSSTILERFSVTSAL